MGADLIAITGAAHGIGAALAREAVGRGYRVALFDRDEAALVELRAALGAPACLVCPGDVTSAADLQSFAEMIGRQGGVLRMVFANAGILRAGEILEQADGEIEQMFAINVFGPIRAAKTLIPLMQKHGQPSVFVVTGSTSMLSAAAGYGAYAASKHALLAITEALDAELSARTATVRAALLCPAAVQTGLADGASDLLGKLQRRMAEHGITAADMAKLAFDALAHKQSVIFSHEPSKAVARERFEALISGQFVNSKRNGKKANGPAVPGLAEKRAIGG